MISFLARMGSPQAIGIHLTGSQAHACRVAATPFGSVALAHQSEPVDLERPQDTIRRLINGLSKRRKLPVTIGLPVEQIFFTTRPMQLGGGEASPRVLLREALFSASTPIDEMVVDVVKWQPGSRKLASIVSCEQKLIERLVEPREALGMPQLRVEPSPCALVRRGLKYDRRHRRANGTCRLFLNNTHVLAVLTAKGQPLLWRQSQLPRGDEASTLLAVVRSLATISEHSGLAIPPEVVVIHGRSDLSRLLDIEWMREQIGLPMHWLDDPAMDHAQIAMGLAEGGLSDTEISFDLAKSFAPQRPLWQSFPWREAIVNVALIAVMVLFVSYHLLLVEDAHAAASIRNAQSAMASRTIQELEEEKKDLKQRVSSMQKFLDGRIVWTNYERQLAANLPEGIFMTSMHGVSEFASTSTSKSKQKKHLVLKCAVSLPKSGLIPYEVDRLLNTLRDDPKLNRDFPVIELAELKQLKRADNDQTLAMFTLVCLPKGAKKAK
ncbi:MAG: hypothetical protein ACC628_26025 [Pirellulaceae bacterium]